MTTKNNSNSLKKYKEINQNLKTLKKERALLFQVISLYKTSKSQEYLEDSYLLIFVSFSYTFFNTVILCFLYTLLKEVMPSNAALSSSLSIVSILMVIEFQLRKPFFDKKIGSSSKHDNYFGYLLTVGSMIPVFSLFNCFILPTRLLKVFLYNKKHSGESAIKHEALLKEKKKYILKLQNVEQKITKHEKEMAFLINQIANDSYCLDVLSNDTQYKDLYKQVEEKIKSDYKELDFIHFHKSQLNRNSIQNQ